MERIYHYLPEKVSSALRSLSPELKKEITEIRLRKNAHASLSTYSKNLFLNVDGKVTNKIKESLTCDAKDIALIVNRFCQGSVYRYMSTINTGFIVTDDGVRVGVCGEGIYDGGKINSVSSFSSVNIRLSREIDSAGDAISKYLAAHKNASVLIVSPPGYGKTTVIRSVAKAISGGKFSSPLRVSVIDERGEILLGECDGLIDRFLGYSKPDGIEIAVRLFSPEYVICDEIGLSDDTKALLSVQNSGVPFIATTHGRTLVDALKRPNIKELVEHGIFDTFVRIEKSEKESVCVFEEIER